MHSLRVSCHGEIKLEFLKINPLISLFISSPCSIQVKNMLEEKRSLVLESIDRVLPKILLIRMRKPTSATATAKPTPCCIKVGLKRGPWTPEEDELLATYIKKEGEGRWRTLPKKAGLLRCGKSCRLRWMNYLRPSVKRGQIADDEEDLILRLHRLLSKKLISQGIDPRTHKPLDPQSFDPSKPSLSKANLDVQHLANHFIASQGYTGLLTYDGTSGMDLRGNQRLGIGEADDQDINSGTDDVFSFLNSLINEEAFQQHQILNVPNVNSTAPSSSDPFVSTFGLGITGWESPLMSSALNQNDSK